MEPLPRGAKFQFANEIFGGSIPKNFIPAVEKGIVEAAEKGYLAGFPMVDFKVTVYDGSYHDVDSSELAFKLAARKAFRAAMLAAKPALLEPVMNVEIQAPVSTPMPMPRLPISSMNCLREMLILSSGRSTGSCSLGTPTAPQSAQ